MNDYQTPEIYRRELARMEAAVREQFEWLKNWHLSVFARKEGEELDLTTVGTSPFYVWYKGLPQDLFAESPVFLALGFSLDSMQTLSTQLVNLLAKNEEFQGADYVAFMEAVANFNELVIKLMREALSQIAQVDNLTGVGNETGMRAQILAERGRIGRTNQQACIALAELGDFSVPNEEGLDLETSLKVGRSEIISAFASTAVDLLRPYDQLYRIDNDNFVFCLPYTDTDVANLVINRLHANITSSGLELEDGTQVLMELRFGIAPIHANDEIADVMAHAREALDLARSNALLDVVAWYVS